MTMNLGTAQVARNKLQKVFFFSFTEKKENLKLKTKKS